MGMLSNVPQRLPLRLERLKSYAMSLHFVTAGDDGIKRDVDITGAQLQFTVRQQPHLGAEVVLTKPCELDEPLVGLAHLLLQAADLDFDPELYEATVTMLDVNGYTAIVVAFDLELLDNPETAWVNEEYTGEEVSQGLTILLGGDKVTVTVNHLAAPSFEIGSVTTAPHGNEPSAYFEGRYPTQILNLVLPRGDRGLPGLNGVPTDEAFAEYVNEALSETRLALEAVFGTIFAEKAIQDIVETGRLSEALMIEALSKGNTAWGTINQGRLAESVLAARFREQHRHIPALAMSPITGGTAEKVFIDSATPGWALAGDVVETLLFEERVHQEWSKLALVIRGCNMSAGAGTVQLRAVWNELNVGDNLGDFNTGDKSSLKLFNAGGQYVLQEIVLFPTGLPQNSGGSHNFKLIRDALDDSLVGDWCVISADIIPISHATFAYTAPPPPEDTSGRTFTQAMNAFLDPAGVRFLQQSPPPASNDDSAGTFKLWPANIFASTQDFTASTWSQGERMDFRWGSRKNYDPLQINTKPNYLWGDAYTARGHEVGANFTTTARANMAFRIQHRHQIGLSLTATALHLAMLETDPTAYWHMQETAGTAFVDATGNLTNGAYSGGAAINQAGLLSDGKSVLFDGVDDKGTKAVATIGTFGGLSILMKKDGAPATDQMMSGRWSSTAASEVMHLGVDNTGKPYISARNTAGVITRVTGPVSVCDNVKHWIVGKLEADGTLRLFVDGLEVNSIAFPGVLNNVATGMVVGGRSNTATNAFSGYLSNAGLWVGKVPSDEYIELAWRERLSVTEQWNALPENPEKPVALNAAVDFITEAFAKANLDATFPENFEHTRGHGAPQWFAVSVDKVILPTGRLVDGALPGLNIGTLVDYEVSDDRTPQETLDFFRAVCMDAHSVNKIIYLYTNPLTSGILLRHGITDDNIAELFSLVDYFNVMLSVDNPDPSITDAYNNAIARLNPVTADDWLKVVLGVGIGDTENGNSLTLAQARTIHSFLVAPGGLGPSFVNIWRYFGDPGGDMTLLYNQILRILGFGDTVVPGLPLSP